MNARRSRVAVATVVLVALAAAPAAATWTDPVSISGTSLDTATLDAPVLSCTQQGLTSVRISWPIQTTRVPTTPTYDATIPWVTVPSPTVSGSTAYVDVTGALLSYLVAGMKTVSVRGTLPTNWSSPTSTINVTFVLGGLLVSC